MPQVRFMSGIMVDGKDPQTLDHRMKEVPEVNTSDPQELTRLIAKPGDVFQIIGAAPGREGWHGAFVMATEMKSWGIQGFVHMIDKHNESGRAYVRLKWEEIEWIGSAPLVPSDEGQEEEKEEEQEQTGETDA